MAEAKTHRTEQKLTCGCIYSEVFCPEAERLWDRTEFPFRLGLSTGNWESYDRAAAEFRRHFGEEVQ